MANPPKSSYAGKLLFVDLTGRKSWTEPLDDEMKKGYLGGVGFNAKLAYDLIKPRIDPLGPENIILISAGALTGTSAPGTPKTDMANKSPLTNLIGNALSGHFGTSLKFAGYDQLIIMGAADSPVYIEIIDSDVKILKADDLWGKDAVETTQLLYSRYQPREISVAAIGQAGENKVAFSFVLADNLSTFGRSGSGAVWGAKKLKAVVLHGSNEVGLADVPKFNRLYKNVWDVFMAGSSRENWTKHGTILSWPLYSEMGNLPRKNWHEAYPAEELIRLYGPEAFVAQAKKSTLSCVSCPSGCKSLLEVKEGAFKGSRVQASCPLGGAMAYGAWCEVGDYNRVIKCYETANRLGLDNFSTGNLISFAVDCYERGLLKKEDADGMELKHDFDTTMALMKKIARREGIGDVLARGWKAAVDYVGGNAEDYAVHVRGLDPTFEPRASFGTENFGAFVSPRGGHDTKQLSLTVVPGRTPEQMRRYCGFIGVPDSKVGPIITSAPSSYPGINVGRLTKWVEDYNVALESMGICNRPEINKLYNAKSLCEWLSAATGIDLEVEELLAIGERTWTLLNLFNAREGFTRKKINFPSKWFKEEMKIGERVVPPLSQADINCLLDHYFEERGWDAELGLPTKAKLAELGLGQLADDPDLCGLLK